MVPCLFILTLGPIDELADGRSTRVKRNRLARLRFHCFQLELTLLSLICERIAQRLPRLVLRVNFDSPD